MAHVYPRYRLDAIGDAYADFYRAKVMLHHPFHDENLADLLSHDNQDFMSWPEACLYCSLNHTHPEDPLGSADLDKVKESQTESVKDENTVDPHHRDEEILGARRPHGDGDEVEERYPSC